MSLSDEQKNFYENTLEVTRKEIEELDSTMKAELAKVKERLANLQNAKDAAEQMYDAACRRLGRANDLDTGDEDETVAAG